MPSAWIGFKDGRLVYRADAYGNRIPDFSSVGYHRGDRAVPRLPVAVTVGPAGSGDDTARIQTAVQRAAAGGGGAVLLKPGTYRIGGTVRLNRSGVVLRGSGAGTVLTGTGKPHTLVTIGGRGKITRDGVAHRITDRYVPVGSATVHVDGAARYFAPGDRIVVQRPIGNKWIHEIGMDRIPPRRDGGPVVQWRAGPGHQFQRTVRRVSGNTISLDVRLPQALERKYTNATVWKYQFPGRISEAGLEDLTANGQAFESDPSWQREGYFDSRLVSVDNAENSWVRSVTATRFGQAFSFGPGALHSSILNTQSLDVSVPSKVQGTPAAYSISGQQTLIRNCRVKGTNVQPWATMSRVPGPNVITNCTAVNTGSGLLLAGPHQRWATGTLYDRVRMNATGTLAVEDRRSMGTGQGWAGANNVLWNCSVGTYDVEKPPTAYNWAIGCTGAQAPPPPDRNPGQFQSPGRHVHPASLYEQQLHERHNRARPAHPPAPRS
ncbi:hypothetical protein ABIE67_010268 [Streptomyces sp. V4I8]